jgi:SAM-dependent methyltransferase
MKRPDPDPPVPTPSEFSSPETQRRYFNAIAEKYHRHYGDPWSKAYRDRFINAVMLEGISIEGKDVLDGLCGGGETTEYLLDAGARVTGLDISDNVIEIYKKDWPGCGTRRASILETGYPDAHFDAVIIVGGLHHTHPHCLEAVREVHRILKPGGYFCFAEPHVGSFLDTLRIYWYRHDKSFMPNEAAVDVEELKREFASGFEFLRESHGGNIAYLLVLNSMVFHIPGFLKRFYSPILLWLERLLRTLQGRRTSCFAACAWRKR